MTDNETVRQLLNRAIDCLDGAEQTYEVRRVVDGIRDALDPCCEPVPGGHPNPEVKRVKLTYDGWVRPSEAALRAWVGRIRRVLAEAVVAHGILSRLADEQKEAG